MIHYITVHFKHPQYDRSPLCYVVFLLVCFHACVMYVRMLTSLLDGLDNALVSLCVWNAVCKYHAFGLSLVMFEGLLRFGFIWFHLVSFHFILL
jgi:hypothetical protein